MINFSCVSTIFEQADPNSTKISIGIVTSTNLRSRYLACKNTWTKDFDHVYYFVGNDGDDPDQISVPGAGEDYNSYFPKQQYALMYMYELNPNDDWYCVIGCDHILFKRNIENFLKDKNSNIDQIFCETWRGVNAVGNPRIESIDGFKFELFAGGAGFFLSNSAMRKLYQILVMVTQEWFDICSSGRVNQISMCSYASGDVALAYSLSKYLNLQPTHVDGMYSQNPCSDPNQIVVNPLTLHRIKPEEMKEIYERFNSN